MGKFRTRVAVAVVSAAVIALELLLMRALSLRFWHHFSYLIVATALLGFGASGTLLTLLGRRGAAARRGILCAAALALAVAIGGAVRLADRVDLNVQFLTWDLAQAGRLLAVELIFFVPMLLGGLAVGAALLDEPKRVSGHYAASLIGSGAGAVMGIALLEWMSLPAAMAALSAGALLAGAVVVPWRRPAGAVGAVAAAGAAVAIHLLLPWAPVVSQYKTLSNALRMPGTEVLARRSGPLGRIDVVAGPAIHPVPAGMSVACPAAVPPAALIVTDGDRAGTLYQTSGQGKDFAFLDWTTSALPYKLLAKPAVLVLGAGGGERIGLARHHGSPRVVAVEPNPQVIELMRGPLRGRGGAVYDGKGVHVVEAGARGFLAATRERFDLIELPLVDASASAGAGVYAGAESYLFTEEAFGRMLSLLTPGGIVSVTCEALRNPPRDVLRVLYIAEHALRASGRVPRKHLLMIKNYDAVTVLLFAGAVTQKQIDEMVFFCEDRSFNVEFLPGEFDPALRSRHEPSYWEEADLIFGPEHDDFLAAYAFDVRATTDDRPYFFNFFRFRALEALFDQLGNVARGYLEIGYLLLLALYYAFAWLFEGLSHRRFAFMMASLGSGLGWLALLVGHTAVDMWVPEGYVFYSLYVNVHFPLAIALMLLTLVWSVTPWEGGRVHWLRFVGVTLCAATLGVVQIFCLATVGLTLLTYTVWRWAQQRRLPWHQVASGLAIGAAGLPLAVNAYLAVQRNPVYAAWSAQNQTPSPPPWEYALGYGVVLVLAAWGGHEALRRRHGCDLFLLSWAVSTIALLYVPFSLQRRFVMGLIIPLGGLAAIGWCTLPGRWRPRVGIAWGVASPSHLLLIGMSIVVALTQHQAPSYMERDEHAAMRWLADHIPQDALVAAAPETGLFIPAWAGQRVFYGHPFETAQAERREAEVRAFMAEGDLTVLPYRPDYVFYGERELALRVADWSPEERWQAVYRNQTVAVYAVSKD